MKKITALKILENYHVWLRFDDGVEGTVDFSHKPHTGVFAVWQDYDFFRRASIADHGALTWPGELDLCPDSLWLQVTGKTVEELFPNLKTLAAHA